jgi:uncharacterized protein (DUF2147 family)
MKRWLRVVLLLPCLAVASLAAPGGSIAGTYRSEAGDHRIELFLRGERLFGRIAWTRDPNLEDSNNEDPKLRGRRLVGLEHLRDFARAPDASWVGGSVYNPEDGRTYDATLWLASDQQLVIQGRPRVPILAGILGVLFGRILYERVEAEISNAAPSD